MKVSQSGKLNVSSNTMMKLALMRTAPEKSINASEERSKAAKKPLLRTRRDLLGPRIARNGH